MSSKASNFGKSSFGQTLHFITHIKLAELEKQRLAYEAHAKVLDESKALAEKGDILKQVNILAKAALTWRGSGVVTSSSIIGGKLKLSDLQFWLQQAEHDPSFNLNVARGWAETLEEHIRHTVMRFDSAKLFGSLFNEWIASGDSSTLAYQAGPEDTATDSEDTMSFEHVELGRKEMRDQRDKLDSIIFEDRPVDTVELKAYMTDLFAWSSEATEGLTTLRREMGYFSSSLQRKEITTSDVGYAIQGLLASGLMDEEKREALKSFEENDTIMAEIVSVLNMRMNSLGSWGWPKEGTLVEFRRHLNGKYRAFTDPEIVDALLLHYIGVSWQVKMKACLRQLFDSKAWVRPVEPTNSVRQRRNEQLCNGSDSQSIDVERNNTRRENFFLSQLHELASKPSRYDDLVDAPELNTKDTPSPATIKRKLLHIMMTECHLNKALHGSHSMIRSDMEMFGPSLPHDTILAVLDFLGMSKTWIDFFKAFLSAPLFFPGDTVPRVRRRGTPISYALSVVCGEAALFIMDFAVNQRASLHLYRMHDDLWIWDSNPKKVAEGWAEMNKYAAVAGLKFNQKKTGSSFVGPRTEDHAMLPEGDIRWGFLKFDPEASRFVIDQKDVDNHIIDMKRQLDATKSVFGWINAYNKYMSFFLRNFGGVPANCFNKSHVTDLIDTMGRIQLELFPKSEDNGTGAVGYLRRTLEERFGIKNLPEGYLYFPVEKGGLGLRNRVLELLALERRGMPISSLRERANDWESSEGEDGDDEMSRSAWHVDDVWGSGFEQTPPEEMFKDQVELDKEDYDWMKKMWEEDTDMRRVRPGYVAELDGLMSFEKYVSLRESRLYPWVKAYRDMLESPEQRDVALVPKVREALEDSQWRSMDWYEKWIVSMYGGEVIERFGGLEVVDRSLIPIGMVELFRTSRMKLDH